MTIPQWATRAHRSGEMSDSDYNDISNFNAQVKEASSGMSPGQMAALVGGMALAPVIGKGVEYGMHKMRAKGKGQLTNDLKAILRVNPSIGSVNDPQVMQAYLGLLDLNPEVASNPMVAAPMMETIMRSRVDPMDPKSSPYIDPSLAKTLIELRKYSKPDMASQLGSEMGSGATGSLGQILKNETGSGNG